MDGLKALKGIGRITINACAAEGYLGRNWYGYFVFGKGNFRLTPGLYFIKLLKFLFNESTLKAIFTQRNGLNFAIILLKLFSKNNTLINVNQN
jgi:hypothetical protein